MEIASYELFEVPPRWVFLRIETSDGVVGWGEPTVEGYTKTIVAAVSEIMDNYLLRKDPLEIEHHWQAIYRGRHFRNGPILMSAIAGIDQALWDIKGKCTGSSVYELLGGPCRDRIATYQWVGGKTPSEVAESASSAVEAGYQNVKMTIGYQSQRTGSPDAVETARNRLAAVRDVVGDEIGIGVDFRGRFSKGMAKWLVTELDAFGPMFYEEPVFSEHADALPQIACLTHTPLATDDRLYSRAEFKSLLSEGYVDLIRPNPANAGGITEIKKIASAAEINNIPIALQCTGGPISFAAGVQLDMAMPNAVIQSQHLDIHKTTDNHLLAYLEEPACFGFADGYVVPPDAPGLGIEIDETYVREQAKIQVDWQEPLRYHEDGTVFEA